MSKIDFSPVDSVVHACPCCGCARRTATQDDNVVKVDLHGVFRGGDTVPHDCFGGDAHSNQYDTGVEISVCPECSSELVEVLLCVTSDPAPRFFWDGFEVADREQLLQVSGLGEAWVCIREHGVNDRMGDFARIHRRYDLHILDTFVADDSAAGLWRKAGKIINKFGPSCLEYMQNWAQENGGAVDNGN